MVVRSLKLLTRDEFRESVFRRDNYKCVVCKAPALDAHHILERRLWPDGGYYLDNGASVCEEHHLDAERTIISCDRLRELAGISNVAVPDQFYSEQNYDKWGNPVLENGTRMPGELFYEGSVQKILAEGNALALFTKYVKYPRTYHLPWSQGLINDDKVISGLDAFEGRRVIVTVKMDGENTTFYNDYLHARAINSQNRKHESRDIIKQIHAQVKNDIPDGWRLCGENLYAEHSIAYSNLPAYFMLFSVWNDKNICLSWDETKDWADLLNFYTVPILYDGIWDEQIIKTLYSKTFGVNECEGYVVRLADSFHYKEFRYCVAKFVREKHIQTDQHWLNKEVVPNKLRK